MLPNDRRRMHEQRFVESKAVAKEQFLTAGLGDPIRGGRVRVRVRVRVWVR